MAADISSAERRLVPLNSRCSKKCEAPATLGDSSREPTFTQMPKAALLTSGIFSVTMRKPLECTVLRTDITIRSLTLLELESMKVCPLDRFRRSQHGPYRQLS